MTSSNDSDSLAMSRKQASLIANTGRKIGYSIFFLALTIFTIGFLSVSYTHLTLPTILLV